MLLIDAHVHIYDCFDLQIFFDSAFANFKSEASRLGYGDTFTGILLLTETSGDSWFERLKGYSGDDNDIGSKTIGGWAIQSTREKSSLRIVSGSGQILLLIAGRQIVSVEKLEVLALITERQFEDYRPLKEVIQDVKESGAIPVIPWGFGKWYGKRGKILENKLKGPENSELFLGDNGGRAAFLPPPYHFKLAASKGIRVLPGSDPLPFPSESQRPGSFGFSMNGTLDPKQPGQEIKRILSDPDTCPKPYGSLENPYHFLRNQLRMQILKQRGKLKDFNHL